MNDALTIATRAFNTPLLLAPAKAAVIAQQLGPRFLKLDDGARVHVDGMDRPASAEYEMPRPQAASLLGDEVFRTLQKRGGGYSNIGGVAVIPIVGTLVRRGSHIGNSSGVTSYEGISAQIRAAAGDPDARAIALEIDSFGGEAAGLFALAADIRAARAQKPVYAFLADYALSAGYGIASQADQIIIPPFGQAGSIGVVSMHMDIEKKLQNEGVTITLVHSGAHKVEGNSFQALPEGVRLSLQKDNDLMWSRFAQEVAAGRGDRLTAADALRTEAAVLTGQAAVDAGLADQVSEARPALQALIDQMNPSPVPMGGLVARAPAASLPLLGEALGGQCVTAMASAFKTTPLPSVLAETIRSSGCITGADALFSEETAMSVTKTKPDANVQAETTVTTPAATPVEVEPQADQQQAERARTVAILGRVEKAGLPQSFAQKLIADGVSLETAFGAILDEKAATANDGGDIRNTQASTRITGDVRDRTRQGMTVALMAKAGLEGGERNEFTSMSLREMARTVLTAQGASVPHGGVMQLASAAFAPASAGAMHTTSDFGNILADIANKSMLKGFEESPEIFERFTSVGTMGDFKPTKRVGLDNFPSLLKVEEGGEFKYGTMGDFGETAVLATYGRLFAISRQTIINDDLDAFTKVPAKMGRAARRTVGDLVFAMIKANAQMADGVALFASAHNNLASSGALPSEAAINDAIVAMSKQSDNSGNSKLNITPKYLLAPPEYRAPVLQALNSEYAPDDTSKVGSAKMGRAYNTVRDAAEPLFDARIDDGSWYMLGDPSQYDTIEVGYLDGITTPWLDQQDGWTVDGTEFKVRIDATATALAHQALYKNAGS